MDYLWLLYGLWRIIFSWCVIMHVIVFLFGATLRFRVCWWMFFFFIFWYSVIVGRLSIRICLSLIRLRYNCTSIDFIDFNSVEIICRIIRRIGVGWFVCVGNCRFRLKALIFFLAKIKQKFYCSILGVCVFDCLKESQFLVVLVDTNCCGIIFDTFRAAYSIWDQL